MSVNPRAAALAEPCGSSQTSREATAGALGAGPEPHLDPYLSRRLSKPQRQAAAARDSHFFNGAAVHENRRGGCTRWNSCVDRAEERLARARARKPRRCLRHGLGGAGRHVARAPASAVFAASASLTPRAVIAGRSWSMPSARRICAAAKRRAAVSSGRAAALTGSAARSRSASVRAGSYWACTLSEVGLWPASRPACAAGGTSVRTARRSRSSLACAGRGAASARTSAAATATSVNLTPGASQEAMPTLAVGVRDGDDLANARAHGAGSSRSSRSARNATGSTCGRRPQRSRMTSALAGCAASGRSSAAGCRRV